MGDAADEGAAAPVEAATDARTCGDVSELRACDATDDAIVDALRVYIAADYERFAASELTFRMLKEHLVKTLDVEYEQLALGTGRYGDTLDDEVDAIAVRCDGGAHNPACVFIPGYEPPVHVLDQYRPQLLQGAAVLAGAAVLGLARRAFRRRGARAKKQR